KKKAAEARESTPVEANDAAIETTTPVEVTAETEAPATAKKKRRAKGDFTLAELAELYAAHMEEEGKSSGTISSYGMELKTEMAELGAETLIASLTPDAVQTYFESKRVTRLRSGKPKSQLSIDKTRRVLRLALVWALGEKAPIPEAPAEARA